MRVRDCEKCTHYDRHRYSTYYGITHIYGFCELVHKKCSEVKKSECDDMKLTAEMNRILKKILPKD